MSRVREIALRRERLGRGRLNQEEKTSMINLNWFALGVCALLAGCSTSGAYIAKHKAQKMEQSVTSAEDLQEALGKPTMTNPTEDGKILWIYEGIHRAPGPIAYIPYVNLLAGDIRKKCTRLTVLVDRETGKLSDWHYSSASAVEIGEKTDKCESAEDGKPK